MNTLLADLRYAVRLLSQSPAFTAIAALTLALGIGATTALFSVVNGVLLNLLAYPHSDRLMVIYARIAGLDSAPIEYPNFLDWQRGSRTFASLAAYRNEDYNFIGNGEGERLSGSMISADVREEEVLKHKVSVNDILCFKEHADRAPSPRLAPRKGLKTPDTVPSSDSIPATARPQPFRQSGLETMPTRLFAVCGCLRLG